jgi:hypothetical protein
MLIKWYIAHSQLAKFSSFQLGNVHLTWDVGAMYIMSNLSRTLVLYIFNSTMITNNTIVLAGHGGHDGFTMYNHNDVNRRSSILLQHPEVDKEVSN